MQCNYKNQYRDKRTNVQRKRDRQELIKRYKDQQALKKLAKQEAPVETTFANPIAFPNAVREDK